MAALTEASFKALIELHNTVMKIANELIREYEAAELKCLRSNRLYGRIVKNEYTYTEDESNLVFDSYDDHDESWDQRVVVIPKHFLYEEGFSEWVQEEMDAWAAKLNENAKRHYTEEERRECEEFKRLKEKYGSD